MSGKTVLVFGASGLSGKSMVEYFISQPSTSFSKIICISRNPSAAWPQNESRIVHVPIDLVAAKKGDEQSKAISALVNAGSKEASFAFFLALAGGNPFDKVAEYNSNVELLQSALDLTVEASPKLEVFTLQTGYKWYGVDLGPYGGQVCKIPYSDSEGLDGQGLRHDKSLFYFGQHDLLKEVAGKNGWKWTEVRPNVVMGASKDSNFNFVLWTGIYASIKAHLNEPLTFPGNAFSWSCLQDHSSATLMAEFAVWTATTPAAHNQSFSFHNGDEPRFKDIWPKIAEEFKISCPAPDFPSTSAALPPIPVEAFSPPSAPIPGMMAVSEAIPTYMADKGPVWVEIAKKHGLDETIFEKVNWLFWVGLVATTWENTATLEKARSLGWTKSIDTNEAYKENFDKLRELKLLPPRAS